ncbi:AAA family ATPase [Desulfovibrio oxamicus]|uniref:AAA family ATPase n=1 Tax=Nitratidesulfovibrio oxamicus TaxID=32016 RepID=A0ABS0J400_9BACT|nr:AAA family ATPase [Nitratidesulfovibrio oxamicus]
MLILTGTPGSGKTTTAQLLAMAPESPKVHLHSDDFWHFIKNGAVPPYLPEAHRQNTVVVDVLASAAAGYAKGGYFVIVDGIIGPWFLEPFKALSLPLYYAVLRPSLDNALRRCYERSDESITPEGIVSLHRQFSSLGDLEKHVILVDGKSREEMVSTLTEAVQSGVILLLP